jgi:hypothetical protein
VIQDGTLKAGANAGFNLITTSLGLDIQKGRAQLDYSADPATWNSTLKPQLAGALQLGYNDPTDRWSITSAHPVGCTTDTATIGLGWSDNGVTQVATVMYTLYGDADLNGTVNGADLNVVLSNYNQTGMYWYQGDFNYDGSVNGSDLNTVLSNYNQSLSVGAAVPEPSALFLAAAGLAGLLAFGRRKQKRL